ncbi:IclR family transcriptional regulator [Nocardioides sp.]|uniref:IclR family transcriptional regulator n=1 Tax=Nocardioides sp. TaxID=35761 RepID=UPI0035297B0B
MSDTTTASGTQAVDRAALLVSTVVEADTPLAFAEIAEECGLPKSTTSRLLTALERTELLERDPSGAYVAGPLFWRYASRFDPFTELSQLALPTLEAVGEATGETVTLGMPRGDDVVHVAQVDSRFHLGTRDWTQVQVPSHASALGKVLFAYAALPLPDGPLEQLTEQTRVQVAALRADLDGCRRRGYATTVDELELGLSAVAAPVRDHHGDVVAALGISGPTARLQSHLAAHGRLLKNQAEQLTELLVHRRKAGVA